MLSRRFHPKVIHFEVRLNTGGNLVAVRTPAPSLPFICLTPPNLPEREE
jgi:hypothetical protein